MSHEQCDLEHALNVTIVINSMMHVNKAHYEILFLSIH